MQNRGPVSMIIDIEAHRYLNMNDLREHKKTILRQAA
jgi:hypothetical protein